MLGELLMMQHEPRGRQPVAPPLCPINRQRINRAVHNGKEMGKWRHEIAHEKDGTLWSWKAGCMYTPLLGPYTRCRVVCRG